jgi:hypothetical protein
MVHALTTADRLHHRDLDSGFGNSREAAVNVQADTTLRHVTYFRHVLVPVSIEQRHGLASGDPQDPAQVMRLASIQLDSMPRIQRKRCMDSMNSQDEFPMLPWPNCYH